MEKRINTIQTSINHEKKPWTNWWTPVANLWAPWEKPMNKCKCKISVPKMSSWYILAPKCAKKKQRAPDPGSSHVFVTKVLLPDDAAPGISATLAKTIHLVHVNVCSYFCWSLNPTFALSPCRFPQSFLIPIFVLFDMCFPSLSPVRWCQQCFAA